ncbi:MAG: ATP-binding cassette domain-containing protein [Acidobacteria bacterium]|nr:ATP-binding cassette domain-containing protein [Acidobacteriota bacterium]
MELLAAFTRRFKEGPEVHGAFTLPMDGTCLTVLFGPSGCGKTTMLRALAGLDRPEAGRVLLGEEIWSDADRGLFLPAHKRRIGFLSQAPSLFPHLSVEANVAFGLKRDLSRARETLELTGLLDLAHRRPHELSGGQQQRVALARALAPRPRLLLLDEPFAALDAAARREMGLKLRQALAATGTPALLVTHAREEALALGDRMMLMQEGRIIRHGLPSEVLSLSAGPGQDAGTVLKVRVVERAHGLARVQAGTAELWAPDPGGLAGNAYATIRPEGVSLEQTQGVPGSARNRLAARILGLEPEGALIRVKLDAGFELDALITAWAAEDLGLAPGAAVTASIKATAIRLEACAETGT